MESQEVQHDPGLPRLRAACMSLVSKMHDALTLDSAVETDVRALKGALGAVSPWTVATSLPAIGLPLYAIITEYEPGVKGRKSPKVMDTFVLALDCIEAVALKSGALFLHVDPSIFLKLITQLTSVLAEMCGRDSSRSVEETVQKQAVLRALRAVIRCGRDDLPERAWLGGEGQDLEHDSRSGDVKRLGRGHVRKRLTEHELQVVGTNRAELEFKSSKVLTALVSGAGGAIVAQIVQGMLDIVATDKDRETRLLAISALHTSTDVLESPDVWRPFFPGVFGGLMKVVLGDYKQGSRVITHALSVLLGVTAMVASDEANTELVGHLAGVAGGSEELSKGWSQFCAKVRTGRSASVKPKRKEYMNISLPAKTRVEATKVWSTDLQARLSSFMPLVLRAARTSPSLAVRRTLAQGLSLLLETGPNFWSLHIPERGEQEEDTREDVVKGPAVEIVDTLVGLARDDAADVASTAEALLAELRSMQSPPPALRAECVSSRLRTLCSSLDSSATASLNDKALSDNIRLASGYLQLLQTVEGQAAARQLLTADLTSVMGSLATMLEADGAVSMQVMDPLPMEDDNLNREGLVAPVGYYRQSFRHIRDARTVVEAKGMLRLLGQSCPEAAYLIVDYVLGKLKGRKAAVSNGGDQQHEDVEAGRATWALERVPLVLIMNNVIVGAGQGSDEVRQQAVVAIRLLLEAMLLSSGGAWHLQTRQRGEAPTGDMDAGDSAQVKKRRLLPVELLDANARLVAALIEGVGDCCEVFVHVPAGGMRGLEQSMMLALFPLVEKLGDGHPIVRQAALTTLYRVSRVCPGCTSLGQLLSTNLDYLVEGLTARVRRVQGRRGAAFPFHPDVLEALLLHMDHRAGLALIRELTSLVMSVVDVEGRTTSLSYTYGMMRVLHAMVCAVTVPSAPTHTSNGKRIRRRAVEVVRRVPAAEYWSARVLAEFSETGEESGGGKKGSDESAAKYFEEYHARKGADQRRDGVDERLEVEKLCPEAVGAMHGAEGEEEEEDEDDKPSAEEAVLQDVLDRCTYFLSCPSLFIQHTVVCVVVAALDKLSARRIILLPTVHKVWPAVIARLRSSCGVLDRKLRPGSAVDDTLQPNAERSSAIMVAIKCLDLAGSLATLCGDFMSFKFNDDLWPLLRDLLTLLQRASRQQQRGRGLLTTQAVSQIAAPAVTTTSKPDTTGASEIQGRLLAGTPSEGGELSGARSLAVAHVSLDRKLEAAAVRCLTRFCESEACFRYTVPLVNDIGTSCAFLLGRGDSGGGSAQDVAGLYRALCTLDAAALWPTLMEIAGVDVRIARKTSSRPPNAHKIQQQQQLGRHVTTHSDEERQAIQRAARDHFVFIKGLEERSWCVEQQPQHAQ